MDVELSLSLTLLFYFPELQRDVSCHQVVVTVGICTTTHSDISEGPAPLPIDKDVVSLVGCYPIREPPSEFVYGLVWEDGTTNYTVVFKAEVDKTLTIVIPHTTAMPPYSSVTVVISGSNLGVHVTHNKQHIMLRDLGDGSLLIFVPVILVLYLSFICWSITLYDGQFTMFRTEASPDDSVTHRFPFFQGFCLLFGDYEGHIMNVFVLMS